MKKLTVDHDVLMFAFDYALTRNSYAPSVVIENIKENVPHLTDDEISTYIDKITDCLLELVGIDKLMWIDLQSYLTEVLESRKDCNIS